MRNLVDMGSFSPSSEEPNYFPVANATVPYWRTELHEIDEYRSTKDVPEECDIAIIGAGLAGVSMAYHLTKLHDGKKQPSIVMLEARQVCSGATGRNGGHIKTKTDTMFKAIDRFGLKAATEFRNLVAQQKFAMKDVIQREGLDVQFELRRSYDCFIDQDEANEVKQKFFASVGRGEEWTRDVDFVLPEHVEQVTSIHNAKAAFSSSIASFWPYKFVTQLLSCLVKRYPDTLNLQTNTPVTKITSSGTTPNIIHTSRGQTRARKLIFATNAYTPALIPAYKEVITPYKGLATHLVPSHPISPHLSHTYNIAYLRPSSTSDTRVDYLNPQPDSSIVVGGANWTFNHDKSSWWNTVDDSTLVGGPATKEHFDSLMQTHFKGWEESSSKVKEIWTGIQGSTGDGMPHVGAVPGEKARWVLAGFNGGGNAVIWLTAKSLADMVVTGVDFKETGLPAMFETTAERMATA